MGPVLHRLAAAGALQITAGEGREPGMLQRGGGGEAADTPLWKGLGKAEDGGKGGKGGVENRLGGGGCGAVGAFILALFSGDGR